MSLIRFGVSIPKVLSHRFDQLIRRKKYHNRSEAIRDLIREALIEEEIDENSEVVGVVNILYDHHHRELNERLVELQHKQHHMVLSAMHVHLDHDNCVEVIIVKGQSGKVKELAEALIASKGVKHGALNITSTGKNIL
jgi:CopG family nickel-responsive transcriptional regulator